MNLLEQDVQQDNMREALFLLKDAMISIVISISLYRIRHGDAHAFERLLFIVLLFSF